MCVFAYKGAWWYGSTYGANLNGKYGRSGDDPDDNQMDGVVWFPYKRYMYSLKTVTMKLRPYLSAP